MPETATQTPQKYDVKIHAIHLDGTIRANASVNLYGEFAVRGVKIMEGTKGLFVSMPSFKAGNGEYKDICFPCTKEAKAAFDKAVIDAYQQALTQSRNTQRKEPPEQQAHHQPAMVGM